MNTIDGMKVIRAITPEFDDLVIVGTEEQIVRHVVSTSYQYIERCRWFNTIKRDVQSKVIIAIDHQEEQFTHVHNMRDDFKGSLKQLELMHEMFDCGAIVRLVDVLYLPALEEEEEAPKAEILIPIQ